ncbi:MAG: hypothetical protein BroJett011_61820 [Chloroflexota bacterium]|nr:MAG: hypothetical protein BroJett011_61820 [Chloroflexota bacterium]
MDNPLPIIFGMFCLAPLAIFFVGVWVGRGLPGMPVRVRLERVEGASPAGGRRLADDWQP